MDDEVEQISTYCSYTFLAIRYFNFAVKDELVFIQCTGQYNRLKHKLNRCSQPQTR